MKKQIILLLIVSLFTFNNVNAASITIKSNDVKIINNNTLEKTRGEIFSFFSSLIKEKIPESYKYINVNFYDVKNGSDLEKDFQKLIYLNLIENPYRKLGIDDKLNAYSFYKLYEKIFNKNIILLENKKELLNRNANLLDFNKIKYEINKTNFNFKINSTNKEIKQKSEILQDVYKTVTKDHYNHNKIDEIKVIDSAIEGITKATDDKYTIYFPPIKNKVFQEHLDGSYEGIGSYVEMQKPGVLIITTPIAGSPSEKAGLKGGDIIREVDGKKITEENSLLEAISWIKGPSGSKVNLTIDRKGKILNIEVVRGKIILKDIESKKINSYTYYIQIKSFGSKVSGEFKQSLENIKKDKRIKKIIIDLRGNGGGYLDQVTKMLSYFVKKGDITAVIKYRNHNKNYRSNGYDLLDFSKYRLIILQNSGTASASEIMIGTIKDYFPKTTLIGEKTYGKGSVQTIKNYRDGSSLKYTIAKWFTGGTETGIDGVGINPDIKLELDLKKFNKNNYDNQLNKAINLR